MTVYDLILELNRLPQDSEIFISKKDHFNDEIWIQEKKDYRWLRKCRPRGGTGECPRIPHKCNYIIW